MPEEVVAAGIIPLALWTLMRHIIRDVEGLAQHFSDEQTKEIEI